MCSKFIWPDKSRTNLNYVFQFIQNKYSTNKLGVYLMAYSWNMLRDTVWISSANMRLKKFESTCGIHTEHIGKGLVTSSTFQRRANSKCPWDLILSLRHVCDCEILIFRALIKNRVVSCWSMLFSHTIVRLTTRSLSRPLYSARYCSQISGVSAIPTMAVQQPAWTLPTRKTDEPVLKVYNSLTRTKVNKCSLVSLVSNVLTESGIDGVRAIYWEPCEVV